MRRGNMFWGLILILLGVLFLLQARGVIGDVLGWFWPLALILAGFWVLWARFLPHSHATGDKFTIELKDAARLNLDIDHGAGSLLVKGGARSGVAVSGLSGTSLEISHQLEGDHLDVTLQAGPTFLPFLGPEGGEWQFDLTQDVPVSIKLDTGASNLVLDMTDVKLSFLGINAGASSIKVKLPASAGNSLVDIEAGAASIDLLIPEGVGARIRIEQGISSVKIDEIRFPSRNSTNNLFESEGFETAENKVEISLEGGASSMVVR